MFLIHRQWNTSSPVDGSLFEQFGGFLSGTVGSLWALAGVILFYIALTEQREDFKTNRANLELQREELRLNTDELKAQRIEFEKQNETLAKQHETLTKQQFENTFFSLLRVQQDIRSSVERIDKRYLADGSLEVIVHKGFTFFELLREEMVQTKRRLTDVKEKIAKGEEVKNLKLLMIQYKFDTIEDLSNEEKVSRCCYINLFNKYHTQLGHYFRNLYHLLKFLYEYESEEFVHTVTQTSNIVITEGLKKTIEVKTRKKYKIYAEFIQAQMSSSELFLLFYNAVFFSKMKEFVYHYDLIENLAQEDLLNPEIDISFYSGEAFEIVHYNAIELKSRKSIMRP